MKFMLLAAFVMGKRLGALCNNSLFICEDLTVSALGTGYFLIHSAPPLVADHAVSLSPAATTVAHDGLEVPRPGLTDGCWNGIYPGGGLHRIFSPCRVIDII